MFASRHLFAAAAIGLLVCSGGCSAARPLHRSPASIRHSLLKRTPAGTPYEDVVAFLKRERWDFDSSTNVPWIQYPREPRRPVIYCIPDSAGFFPDQEVKTALDVELGVYPALPIFDRHVEASWLFNADNQLLDIWVWKYSDSL